MERVLSTLKSPVGIVSLVFLVGALVFYFLQEDAGPEFDFVVAERGELVQEVSVTGRVKPAEQVDLAFEQAGRVGAVGIRVSDVVEQGTFLLSLERSTLLADLAQATASIDEAEARLAELRRGTRVEEIQALETKVRNAEVALQDAENNVERVMEKADADRVQVYADALTTMKSAVDVAKNSLLVLTDIQYKYFLNTNQESLDVADAKELAITSLFDVLFAGKLNLEDLNDLQGGVYGDVQTLVRDEEARIDETLPVVAEALAVSKEAIDALPIKSTFTSTERANIAAEKSSLNAEIVAVSAKQQAINVQRAVNASAVANAEAEMNTAANALAAAQDELHIKQAGATIEELAAQEAKVQSARAAVRNIETKLLKAELRSPMEGAVTKIDLKIGEFVSAGEVAVSIISDSEFEVEAHIPEVDIAKIQVGNETRITLDAYGSSVVFPATIVEIDPAETIIEGVPTYKVTIQFTEDDPRIRSGMTANIDILTARKDDVVRIPQRAVLTKNGKRIVRVLNLNDEVSEVEVEVGVRGSDGNIEIIEGISVGDRVVLFIEE